MHVDLIETLDLTRLNTSAPREKDTVHRNEVRWIASVALSCTVGRTKASGQNQFIPSHFAQAG